MGAVALPEMKKLKYDPALSTGVVAAGGTLGVLIPPSTVMVIYGILTEQNIAKLFMAGVIPGLLQALFYAVVVGIMCRINPALGPACAPFPPRERVRSLKGTWPVFALFLLVIGGIYKGWFSPSEAAAVGVSGAFALALLRRRLTAHALGRSCMDAVKSTAMIMLVMIGAMLLGYFFSVTRIPFTLASTVGALQLSPTLVMIILVSMYVLLGCVMIPIAMLVLTMPIVFPLLTSLGYDPIWFGVIVVPQRVRHQGRRARRPADDGLSRHFSLPDCRHHPSLPVVRLSHVEPLASQHDGMKGEKSGTVLTTSGMSMGIPGRYSPTTGTAAKRGQEGGCSCTGSWPSSFDVDSGPRGVPYPLHRGRGKGGSRFFVVI